MRATCRRIYLYTICLNACILEHSIDQNKLKYFFLLFSVEFLEQMIKGTFDVNNIMVKAVEGKV